jgi:hypothetical protein
MSGKPRVLIAIREVLPHNDGGLINNLLQNYRR